MKKQVLVFQLGMEFGPQDDPLLSERLGLRSIDASSPHIGSVEGHRQQKPVFAGQEGGHLRIHQGGKGASLQIGTGESVRPEFGREIHGCLP